MRAKGGLDVRQVRFACERAMGSVPYHLKDCISSQSSLIRNEPIVDFQLLT